MRILTKLQRWTWRSSVRVMPLLLLGLSLAGCDGSLFGGSTASMSTQSLANLPDVSSESFEPSFHIDPPDGYGGIYVQVRGAHWPQNMMVLITLEDTQGRSETLAASDTDQTGNLATGFLYPIDQRWLASGSQWVVATTADGKVETKAEFAVVPPGEKTAASSSTTVTTTATTTATTTENANHTVVLPVVAAGDEATSAAPASPESGATTADAEPSSTSTVKQVNIAIEPGNESKSINCRSGQEWITLAILSTADFDARSVVPSTVTVSDGPSANVGQLQNSPVDNIVGPAQRDARTRNKPIAVQSRASTTYLWRWHLADVNQDGRVDLVMQFRLDYVDLTCDAVVVTVAGRTRDGSSFAGSDRVEMVALDQG